MTVDVSFCFEYNCSVALALVLVLLLHDLQSSFVPLEVREGGTDLGESLRHNLPE